MMKRLTLLLLVGILAVGAMAAFIRSDGFSIDRATLIERYRTPDSRFVDVDGVTFHYIERGTGPVVLLLHGDRTNARIWRVWIDELAVTHRVLALDLPGYGLTDTIPDSDYSFTRITKLAQRFLDTVGAEKAAVIGTSVGGIVAYRLAAAEPERVTALVLANAAGLPRAPGESPNRVEPNPFLRWLYRYYWPETFFVRSLPRGVVDQSLVTPALVREFYDMARAEGRAAERAAIIGQYDVGDVASILGAVRQPVLLQWTTKSLALPTSEADRFAAYLTNAGRIERRVYENIGHLIALEGGAAVAQDFAQFLAGIENRTAMENR